jgi:type VI protein secretion system component Hcp
MARSRHVNWSQTVPGARSAPGLAPPRDRTPEAQVLQLQRTAGNRAVTALVARDTPKTKAPPPQKPEKPLPKQTYVTLRGMDPIPVESVQFGSTRHMQRKDPEKKDAPAAPAISEVVITSFQGDHSSDLFKKSLWGEPFSAEIVFVKQPDGQPYLKIKLTNALISSINVSGHGGGPDGKPMESWTLNAEKIEYENLGGGTATGGGG